jgi:hypothetical protein
MICLAPDETVLKNPLARAYWINEHLEQYFSKKTVPTISPTDPEYVRDYLLITLLAPFLAPFLSYFVYEEGQKRYREYLITDADYRSNITAKMFLIIFFNALYLFMSLQLLVPASQPLGFGEWNYTCSSVFHRNPYMPRCYNAQTFNGNFAGRRFGELS